MSLISHYVGSEKGIIKWLRTFNLLSLALETLKVNCVLLTAHFTITTGPIIIIPMEKVRISFTLTPQNCCFHVHLVPHE